MQFENENGVILCSITEQSAISYTGFLQDFFQEGQNLLLSQFPLFANFSIVFGPNFGENDVNDVISFITF